MRHTSRFTTYLADTDEARRIHYELRYRVYCERKAYEQGAFPGVRIERDGYDPAAAHFIVHDRHTDNWVGTARLIFSDRSALPALKLGASPEPWGSSGVTPRLAEVSRLASVLPARSTGDTRSLMQTVITVLLAAARCERVDELVFLISAGLARILDSLGVQIQTRGPAVEHRGRRQLYSAGVIESIEGLEWARKRLARPDAAVFRYSQLAPARPAARSSGRLPGGFHPEPAVAVAV